MFFVKLADHCYLGSSKTVMHDVRVPVECALFCLKETPCAGFNFQQSLGVCDLVHENVDDNPSAFTGAANGCEYWDAQS